MSSYLKPRISTPAKYPAPVQRAPVLGYLTIKGKHASEPEFWFGKGLEYWGLDFVFQAEYFGGRRLASGFVLDYLVFTKPLPTPVWINGEYWHRGKQLTMDTLQQFVMRSFKDVAIPIIVWAKDLKSFDDGRNMVRRLFK